MPHSRTCCCSICSTFSFIANYALTLLFIPPQAATAASRERASGHSIGEIREQPSRYTAPSPPNRLSARSTHHLAPTTSTSDSSNWWFFSFAAICAFTHSPHPTSSDFSDATAISPSFYPSHPPNSNTFSFSSVRIFSFSEF